MHTLLHARVPTHNKSTPSNQQLGVLIEGVEVDLGEDIAEKEWKCSCRLLLLRTFTKYHSHA